jgi:hypothetical protein
MPGCGERKPLHVAGRVALGKKLRFVGESVERQRLGEAATWVLRNPPERGLIGCDDVGIWAFCNVPPFMGLIELYSLKHLVMASVGVARRLKRLIRFPMFSARIGRWSFGLTRSGSFTVSGSLPLADSVTIV